MTADACPRCADPMAPGEAVCADCRAADAITPQRQLSPAAQTLLLILKHAAPGRNHALRRQDIAEAQGWHEREVRDLNQELRRAGVPVGIVRHAAPDAGTYFLAVTEEERAAVLAEYDKPMYSMLVTRNLLARNMPGGCGKQLALQEVVWEAGQGVLAIA